MIAVTQQGKVAVITLAHGKANAMDIEFCRALTGQFQKLAKSKAEAVVITANGPIFSAGVNLLRASEGGVKYLRQFLPALNKMFDAIFNFPKPVVAAINGHAIAGGCVLACCADYRMMVRGQGRIGVTELLVGLPFPALAFEVMRFATGPRYFPELIYTGQTYPADAALERGLLHELVDADALVARGVAAAEMLAQIAPAAFAQTKRQMRLPVTERIKRDGKKTDAAVTKIWCTPASVASIKGYVARTFKKS
ncbi:MAG: enoyl-CoA hydratase/isomerase family protein [Pseudolabrys sp.]|nr:enoyl-CoA hydratase/isomerase family protein [Pseudolabrys sp.]